MWHLQSLARRTCRQRPGNVGQRHCLSSLQGVPQLPWSLGIFQSGVNHPGPHTLCLHPSIASASTQQQSEDANARADALPSRGSSLRGSRGLETQGAGLPWGMCNRESAAQGSGTRRRRREMNQCIHFGTSLNVYHRRPI